MEISAVKVDGEKAAIGARAREMISVARAKAGASGSVPKGTRKHGRILHRVFLDFVTLLPPFLDPKID